MRKLSQFFKIKFSLTRNSKRFIIKDIKLYSIQILIKVSEQMQMEVALWQCFMTTPKRAEVKAMGIGLQGNLHLTGLPSCNSVFGIFFKDWTLSCLNQYAYFWIFIYLKFLFFLSWRQGEILSTGLLSRRPSNSCGRPGQSQKPRNQCGSLTLGAKKHPPGLPLLTLRVSIGRKLELEVEPRTQTQVLW